MKLYLPLCLCLLVCWNIASATISYEKVSFERRKPPRQEGFGTCACGFTLVTLKLPLKDLDKKFGNLKRYHTCMKTFRQDMCELPNICGFCVFKMTTCCKKEDGIYSCSHGHITIRNKEESGMYPAPPGGLGQPLASPWDFPAPSQYYSSGGNPNVMGNLGGYSNYGSEGLQNQGLFPAPPRGFGQYRVGPQGASGWDPQIPSQYPYPGGNPNIMANPGGIPYGSEDSQYGLFPGSSGRFGQASDSGFPGSSGRFGQASDPGLFPGSSGRFGQASDSGLFPGSSGRFGQASDSGLSSDSSGRSGQASGSGSFPGSSGSFGQASDPGSFSASSGGSGQGLASGWDSPSSYFQNPSSGGNMNTRTNAGGFASYGSEDRYFHGGDGGDNVNWMEVGQRWSVPVENYGIYLPVVAMGSGFSGGMDKSMDKSMDVGGPIWDADEFLDEDFKDKLRENAAKAMQKGSQWSFQAGKQGKGAGKIEMTGGGVEAEGMPPGGDAEEPPAGEDGGENSAEAEADSSAEANDNSAKAESSASAKSGDKGEDEKGEDEKGEGEKGEGEEGEGEKGTRRAKLLKESRRKRRELKVADQWLGAIKRVFGFDDSSKTTPKKIICLVPNLITADVKCKEKRKSVKCTRKCKKGFTGKHGKTRKFKCNKSANNWKPHPIGECYASARPY